MSPIPSKIKNTGKVLKSFSKKQIDQTTFHRLISTKWATKGSLLHIYPSPHLHKMLCFFTLETFHVLRPRQIFSLAALIAGGHQTE